VRIWDTTSKQLKTALAPQASAILSLSFSPDGKMLASGTSDGSVALWDLSTNQQSPARLAHRMAVRSISYSPDGTTLATAGDDGTIKLWDVAIERPRTVFPGSQSVGWNLAFSPDSSELAFSHDSLDDTDDSVKIWDVKRGAVRLSLRGTSNRFGAFIGMAYSPDGKSFAASYYHGMRLWDPSTGRETAEFPTPSSPSPGATAWSVAYSPDGQMLVSADGNGDIRLWEVSTGKKRQVLQGHVGIVYCVRFSDDGTTLASGGEDRTVRLWDVRSGRELATLRGHPENVWSLDFSPNGKTLASAGGFVRVWDTTSAKERVTLRPPPNSPRPQCLAFSPDGKTLAVGEIPGGLTLWDTQSWYARATFSWHWAGIAAIAFSPDETMLATASFDGTVKLWTAASEAEVQAQSSAANASEFSRQHE
jgi:WD40 repeat protein